MIFFKYNMKAVKTNELISFNGNNWFFAFATVIIVGGSKVISGELTTGTFSSFIAALYLCFIPKKKYLHFIIKCKMLLLQMKRINDIFAKEATIKIRKINCPKYKNYKLFEM